MLHETGIVYAGFGKVFALALDKGGVGAGDKSRW